MVSELDGGADLTKMAANYDRGGDVVPDARASDSTLDHALDLWRRGLSLIPTIDGNVP